MVEKGLADSDAQRVISNSDMAQVAWDGGNQRDG
jgi:hypothetical protein